MKTFLTDDFLLTNDTARELYHQFAAPAPIFDYHCHLPPEQIASNHQFRNLYEVWLAGDHYKWRAMRTNGIPESHCTGDASDYDKFLAFARTVPYTLRNPLYHWTHLELSRCFGIDELLDAESAPRIWEQANERLASPEMRVHGLLEKSRVVAVCTTDDPSLPLTRHEEIAKSNLKTRVFPTFRPDKSMAVATPDALELYIDQLEEITNLSCNDLTEFKAALRLRHDAFDKFGGRLSDHGLEACPAEFAFEPEAAQIFARARKGIAASPHEAEQFAGNMMIFFGQLDAARGWTKQLHLGARRNNNQRLFRQLGPDTGFDSIGDMPQATGLGRYLDRLDSTNQLPKTILYNVNPRDNYLFATMIGNFQDGTLPGKVQFGSGWWFLDQKEGMEMQINALSQLGLLRRFVGMLTDSRSFLSYIRHEYFRRILCNVIGRDVEAGELPRDIPWMGQVVKEICYENAEAYFGLKVDAKWARK